MSGATREQLLAEGYSERSCTISFKMANLWGFLAAVPFVAAIIVLCMFCSKLAFMSATVYPDFIVLAVLLIASVPVHELLHALGWGIVNRSFEGIRFGFGGVLNPYCHCSKVMTRGQYAFGTLLPLVLLGFVISAVGLITGFFAFTAAGVFNVFAAGADILSGFRVLFTRCDFVLDHPDEVGFFAYTKQKNN